GPSWPGSRSAARHGTSWSAPTTAVPTSPPRLRTPSWCSTRRGSARDIGEHRTPRGARARNARAPVAQRRRRPLARAALGDHGWRGAADDAQRPRRVPRALRGAGAPGGGRGLGVAPTAPRARARGGVLNGGRCVRVEAPGGRQDGLDVCLRAVVVADDRAAVALGEHVVPALVREGGGAPR